MKIALHKKFIAGVAAAAILVTGVGASQARAGDYTAERALAALLGLAVIGAIVTDRNDDDRRKVSRRPVTRDRTVTYDTHGVLEPRPLPRRVKARRNLPEKCLRPVRSDRGRYHVLGKKCLTRNYRFVDSLPRSCERRIKTRHGIRLGWGARCLRERGYRIVNR